MHEIDLQFAIDSLIKEQNRKEKKRKEKKKIYCAACRPQSSKTCLSMRRKNTYVLCRSFLCDLSCVHYSRKKMYVCAKIVALHLNWAKTHVHLHLINAYVVPKIDFTIISTSYYTEIEFPIQKCACGRVGWLVRSMRRKKIRNLFVYHKIICIGICSRAEYNNTYPTPSRFAVIYFTYFKWIFVIICTIRQYIQYQNLCSACGKNFTWSTINSMVLHFSVRDTFFPHHSSLLQYIYIHDEFVSRLFHTERNGRMTEFVCVQ